MVNLDQNCVVIGASHAGIELAVNLRFNGWNGSITVVGEEKELPYQRPPLSKDFLASKIKFEGILLRQPEFYHKNNIELILGTRVERIDRANHSLELSSGKSLPYDKLALATGAKPITPPIPGINSGGVFQLRTANDIEKIKTFAISGKHAVIVGGGYIGLETAAVLKGIGMEVTVLEMASRILERVTSPQISEFYTRVHTEEGVRIVTSSQVTEIQGGSFVKSVSTNDDQSYQADLVIVGVGVIPNTDLAIDAGIEVDNGIVVNEYAESSDLDIVAVGDCSNHFNPIYQQRVRLESVQNAVDQAKIAASNLCGKQVAYCSLPWFWSFQYNTRLQIAGLSQGYDEIITRGDITSSRKFSAFYFAGEHLIAVDCVNSPDIFMMARRSMKPGYRFNKKLFYSETTPVNELFAQYLA